MSLCPEAAERAAMTDDEFWAHVFAPYTQGGEPDYPDPAHAALDADLDQTPCEECGAVGACGWDDEGRPLVHPAAADSGEGQT